MGITIEISDNELFELLGKKDCEIAMNEKTIEAFKAQFEKVKALIVELETLKKAKISLEASNKSLADTNIKLDQALTAARKERDTYKSELEAKKLELTKMIAELDFIKLELSKKTSEVETLTIDRNNYKLRAEDAGIVKYDESGVKDVNHRKGKKRTTSINSDS
jgi:chromosome segregation ATPase